MLIKNNFTRYDSLQNIKDSSCFGKDQQHFWSNDGASIFLKVFSPKNSWVAIAENKPQGLYFSKALFEGLTFGGGGLYSEGLIYGGKFAFQNWSGKPYSWKEIYNFCFVLLCIWGQFPCKSPREGLYLEGQFNGGFFAFLGGLYLEGLIFGILRYFPSSLLSTLFVWWEATTVNTSAFAG